MNIKFAVIISFLFISTEMLIAQASYQFGILPVVNINKKLQNGWKLNFKTETRQLLKEGVFGQQTDFDYQHELVDFALVASKKIAGNQSLAGGYFVRFRESNFIQRLIQQYAITRRFDAFRIGHRFAADQTFQKGEGTVFRLRYRISSEFPLNGQSVDPRELYLKFSNEYLNSFQDKQHDLELRLVPLLGFMFNDNNKLETGLDYRLDRIADDRPLRNRFWIKLNWYIAI